jgi:predicted nucleic acid-binding protein
MSNVDVVDASVAIKWLVPEELSDRAHSLLTDHRQLRRRFVGPPHLHSEVANALHQRMRRRDLTASEVDAAVDTLIAFDVQAVGPPDLYRRALTLARAHQLPGVYDTLYVALAEMLEADLWTDDRGLLRRVGQTFPWVRWIGDYTGPNPA